MEQDVYCAGEFVWTGFDYLGEPTPYDAGNYKRRKLTPEEESRSSYFGIVDLVGIPKDRFYLYRSHWAPENKTIHVLPHWNWPERVGRNVPVYVYTSGDSAELFLNGKSLGSRTFNPGSKNPMNAYRLRWEDVIYEPGELKVVAFKDGEKLGTVTVKTAGEPAGLRLTPDRKKLNSGGDDLCYVLVEAVDKKDNSCPLAMDDISFKVTGPATIEGVGNGNPRSHEEFVANHVRLFYGKAMLIVRASEGAGGKIRIKAHGSNLKDEDITVESHP
jgi:beta-galactosidase